MTRKDYIIIAKAIRQSKDESNGAVIELEAVKNTAENIASELQGDNGNFNKERFLTACGVN